MDLASMARIHGATDGPTGEPRGQAVGGATAPTGPR
jgi:hypothetical protein